MVDPWFHFNYEDYPDTSNVNQLDQNDAFQYVVNTTLRYGAKSTILRMSSLEAAAILLDDSLDFCYIDAQHGIYCGRE
jgi:hypothetical protein